MPVVVAPGAGRSSTVRSSWMNGDRAPVEMVVRRDVGRVTVGGEPDDELAPGERELLAALALERRGHEPGCRQGR